MCKIGSVRCAVRSSQRAGDGKVKVRFSQQGDGRACPWSNSLNWEKGNDSRVCCDDFVMEYLTDLLNALREGTSRP